MQPSAHARACPRARSRLEKCWEELQALILDVSESDGVAGSEELAAAQAIVAKVAPQFEE